MARWARGAVQQISNAGQVRDVLQLVAAGHLLRDREAGEGAEAGVLGLGLGTF
jgi:hypothetical protein